jgi:hypothetical protein
MTQIKKHENKIFFFIFLIFFILFYPMLISIYVFLPLFIGAMSYVFVIGLDKGRPLSLLVSIVYFINLEINLSLPLFLSIISSFVFYVTLYPYLQHFRRCKICKPLLSVVVLDLFYLCALFMFDFIFQTQSIVLDNILLYSLTVDMLVVVLL